MMMLIDFPGYNEDRGGVEGKKIKLAKIYLHFVRQYTLINI